MTTPKPASIPINTFQDILDALDQRPELRESLWRRLVPPEILNLPTVVEEIRTRQSRMEHDIILIKESLTRMEERQGRMEERQGRMEERQDRMEERQDRMETLLNRTVNDLNDLKGMFIGSQYEAKAVRNLDTAARAAGLRRLKPLVAHNMPNDQELMEKLEDAVDQNRITGEESDDIRNADAIAQARDRHTQDWVYLVAEASATVRPDDVYRAVRRARLLRQATGTRAAPVVIGAQISDEAQRLADQENVAAVRLGL